MDPKRKPSALFEIIRKDDQAEQRLKVPSWWRSRKSGEGDDEVRDNLIVSLATGLFKPVAMRLPVGMWLVLLVLLIGLPIGAYMLGKGYSLGKQSPRLARILNSQANPGLTDGLSDDQKTEPGGVSKAPGADNDPLTPGLNYYCLETMPSRYRSEAERAVAFLKKNSVDAVVIDAQNSRIQLIALRGFAKPRSDPQASKYANLLRSLGRAWKAEQKGWSDWADLYAFKYNPEP